MGSKTYTALAFIQYLLKSGTRHSVHSPFVYKLIDEVIRNKQEKPALTRINQLRDELICTPQLIETTDFKQKKKSSQITRRLQTVEEIARRSSVNKKYGRLLFNLVEFFSPQVIIELGTSVGISTLYLSKAHSQSKVFTIECCSAKSEQAQKCFSVMQCANIVQYTCDFTSVLPAVIQQAGKLDFAFIDGDHTYNATIANFEALLSISHNDTVFVFDDIHWSAEMAQAWKQITEHERVTVSIDLFRMGIVFLRKELSRQKFVIRY